MSRISRLGVLLSAGLLLGACSKKPDPASVGLSSDMVSAILKGDDARITALLDSGESVQSMQNGLTPLCIAAMNGKMSAVALFLSKGADVNFATDLDGSTPLMYAAKGGHVEVMGALLAQGAKLEEADKMGANALHYAVMGGSKDAVEFLVNRKPELLKSTTNVGINPLILALNRMTVATSTKSDTDMVAYLKVKYGYGADTLKPTIEGGADPAAQPIPAPEKK